MKYAMHENMRRPVKGVDVKWYDVSTTIVSYFFTIL